jgi:hypothetical protein
VAPDRPGADPQALVRRIGLTDADLSGGATVQPLDGGDTVAGLITLDLCGARFPSEAHRSARHQVYVVPPGSRYTDPFGLSNEVVAYRNAAHAAAAMTEWRAAAAGCPLGVWRHMTVSALPELRYESLTERHDPHLPATDSSRTTDVVTARDSGERRYQLVILQRHGTVLDAVYVNSGSPLTAAQTAAANHLADITGRRLIALA